MEIKNIKMKRTGALPLARSVPMPPGSPYPVAAVSIYFDHMSLPGGLRIKSRQSRDDGDNTVLTLEFCPTRLTCDCIVETKPDPAVSIDTGGKLQALNELSPEKEQWLEQAREQRARLAETANGQKLLIEYNKHNEVYDETFKSRSFARTWRADGLTEQLARDTCAAIRGNTPINDKVYPGKGGDGVSYNAHAFYEQTALSMAALLADPDYDPHQPPKPSKYTAASEAALRFGALVNATGNGEKTTTPLTPEEVYAHVERSDALPMRADAPVDAHRLPRFYAAQDRAAARSAADGDPRPSREDPFGLRDLYDGMLKERAENAQVKGWELYKSPCSGLLPEHGFGARVVVRHAGGVVAAIEVTQFSLPDFDLTVEDASWDASIRAAIAPRLREMDFWRNYFHGAVSEALSEIVREAVARDENFH